MSLTKFAKAMGVGRNTVIKNENGSREPKDAEIEAMVRLSGLPFEFFTTPDLESALAEALPQPGAPPSPLWLALGDVVVRLQMIEAAQGVKLPAGVPDLETRVGAVRNLQVLVRTLQAQAPPQSPAVPGAGGGNRK
jgi:transcriptional regulator with XRE-family HTH domain